MSQDKMSQAKLSARTQAQTQISARTPARQSRTVKVIHNRKNCIGCNSCVSIAPHSWEMDKKDGRAHLIGSKKKGSVYVGEIFECDLEANCAAAEACPMRIIQIAKS